jgi:hypothetical protein
VIGDEVIEGFHAVEEGLASGLRVGVRENDLSKDLDNLSAALHEEHAHGVDIEIDGPDDGLEGLKTQRADMNVAVEGIVNAIAAGADEFSAEFLLVRLGVELARGAGQFAIVR